MPDLSPGTEFAGCRIDEVLGSGGMGVIYRATELRLGRPVALKLIAADRASDPELRERFEREARLTASIDHPNVIPVYAAGEDDGHLYLVMRYVPGTDLHALLRAEGRLAPERAAGIVAQLGRALDAAHAAGLVHRDVKPANVLIAGEHVYLSDFGITRVQAEARTTESGGWIGTVDFMAPEHLRGEPTDARTDVYALGCVLYAALTGTPPFRRDTVPATITAHLYDPPPRPSATPGVPAAFDAVVARALAKDPRDRYRSAGDLGRAALAAAGEDPGTTRGALALGGAAAAPAPVTAITTPVRDSDREAASNGWRTEATRLAAEDDQAAAAERAATRVAGAPETNGASRAAGAEPERAGRPEPKRSAPGPQRPPLRLYRGRRRRIAAAVTSLVLAVPAILVIALVTRGGTPTGPLSDDEVADVARGFAQAYSDEDEVALRRLLTPGVKRVGVGAEQRGRPAVVGEYRRQFAADAVVDYKLADLDTSGGRAGRAEGRYTVTRRGRPPLTGRLVLGVVRRDGEPRIALIATEPRA